MKKKKKVLWTNDMKKFKNSKFDKFCVEHGIFYHFTVKKTP